jgi:eukaryotic-like serine/threonine-protein kinase
MIAGVPRASSPETWGEHPRRVGRYLMLEEIGAGGMARVHLGRLDGPGGFVRTVAIKQLHAQFAREPEFVAMLLDEARLAASVRHVNVVATLEIVEEAGEPYVVMEYVLGESLQRLLKASAAHGARVPASIVSAIMTGVLAGLHAAHEARTEAGAPLGIIHRDVSPQNILVGSDGVARVLDFGIAKAEGRSSITDPSAIKGKIGYMSPEQARGRAIDRRTDICAAGIVLWEAFTTRRLFRHEDKMAQLLAVMEEVPPPVRTLAPDLPEALEPVLARAMAKDPTARYATARELALALERAVPPATPQAVAAWVAGEVGPVIAKRADRLESLKTEVIRIGSSPDRSSAAIPERPPARSLAQSPAIPLIGLGLAVIVIAAIVLVLRSSSPTAAASPPEPVPVAMLVSRVPSAEPTSPPAPSADPGPPSPPGSVPHPPPKGSGPKHGRGPLPPPRASASVAPVPPSAPNCDPPFRARPDGVLVPKPECR